MIQCNMLSVIFQLHVLVLLLVLEHFCWQKDKRLSLPKAEIMIHQPELRRDVLQGSASDIGIMSDYMQKNKKRLNKILAINTGKTFKEISIDTDHDYYMSAQEALNYGIIDKIFGEC